jgi:hypothetical protein
VEDAAPPPRREPRPFTVHWVIDSAIAFLASVLVALMFEIDLGAIIIGSLLVGMVAAPFTRSYEARALERRRSEHVDEE